LPPAIRLLPPIECRFEREVTLGNGIMVFGEVIAIDRFGNAISNLIAPRGGSVEISGRVLPIMRTYADTPVGQLVALVGSSGFVEVAQRDGSAARTLVIARGTPVVLRPPRA